jgi:hypothetical protein
MEPSMLPRQLSVLVSLIPLMVPALGWAGAPGDGGVDPVTMDARAPGDWTPAPADPAEAVLVMPPEATSVASGNAGYADEVSPRGGYEGYAGYQGYAYEASAEPVDAAEPESGRETTLKLGSGYIGLGIAPGLTLHPKGFHPNTRFELEFGGTLEHRYRDLALSFGVVTHLTPYYERKAPSYGADVTMTALLGPIYLRTGLGALGGVPRSHRLEHTAAAIGGVVGVGMSFGRAPMVRVGVDYDLRLTTHGEPIHTFLLALRFVCCRAE